MADYLMEKKKWRYTQTDPSEANTEDDQSVGALIRGRLDTSLKHLVEQGTSAKKTWNQIITHFEKVDDQYIITYLDSLVTNKYVPGASMREHIESMRGWGKALEAAGKDVALPQRILALLLLRSIPRTTEWKALSIALTSTGRALTFDTAAAALQKEADDQERALQEATTQAAAISALVSNAQTVSQRPPRSEVTCYWCNRRGHKEVDCRSKQNGKPQWQARGTSTANTAASSSSPSQQKSGINSMAYTAATHSVPPLLTSAHLTPGTASGRDAWVLDSGADDHLCCRREWFTQYRPCSGRSVIVGDGELLSIEGEGSVTVTLPPSQQGTGGPSTHTWTNVAHAPQLGTNLLSLGKIGRAGLQLSFDGEHSQRILVRTRGPEERIIGCGHSTDGKMYAFKHGHVTALTTAAMGEPTDGSETVACTAKGKQCRASSLALWHDRLAHLNYDSVLHLFNSGMAADGDIIARELPKTKEGNVPHCEACVMGKHHRSPIPDKAFNRAVDPLYRVHMDLCGPMTRGYKGQLYLMLVVDDCTHLTWMAALNHKDDAFTQFKAYVAAAEAEFPGYTVAHLRSDSGGEFISKQWDAWLASRGTLRERTVAHSPFQNGVVERMNRTIIEASRTLLEAAHLPLSLWPLAAYAAVYCRNRSPTTALCRQTPFEAWFRVKPRYLHLRRFGCPAYIHIPKHDRKKLDPKATRLIFVGYDLDSTAYLLWDGKAVVRSRDVYFVEDGLGSESAQGEARAGGPLGDTLPSHGFDSDADSPSVSPASSDSEPDSDHDDSLPISNLLHPAAPASIPASPAASNSGPSSGDNTESTRQRSARIYRENQLKKLTDRNLPGPADHAPSTIHSFALIARAGTQATVIADTPTEPRSFKEAMTGPQATEWKKAGDSEINSLRKAGTFILVPRPTHGNVIGNKMVLKIKRGKDGNIVKYKCRLVAKGYLQRYGVDYVDTYAPVARLPSIRALIAITAHHDLELHQMDVKSAYLNGDLEEEIYMEQPEGYATPGQEHLVCRLQKSLYGLKQAGRTWHHKIDVALKHRGFTSLEADHCIYVRKLSDSLIIIALYVDDLLIAASRLAELSLFKKDLAAQFNMEDLGEASYILGIEIQRDRTARTISIGQSNYITGLLERHNMATCNPVVTPMEKVTQTQLATATNDHNATLEETREYQSIIGGVMYAMLCTRPDIAFAVSTLSQFASNPSALHRQALQRVLRYLRGTVHQRIIYQGEGPTDSQPELLGYSDSDWGQRQDRRSISGYAFLLCGGAISWQSKKQKTVALSTVEAEYMATTQAAKEAIWWRSHLSGLGYDMSTPTTLLSDSQGSIALAQNPDEHARTKHIDIQYHFIRQHLATKTIKLLFIGTAEMAADLLTKALDRIAHCREMGLLGLKCTGA